MTNKFLPILIATACIMVYCCFSTNASAYRLDLLNTQIDSVFRIKHKFINYQDTAEIKFSRDTFAVHHYTYLTEIFSIELPEVKECVVKRFPSEGLVYYYCLFPYGFCILSGNCFLFRIKPEQFGIPQYICQKQNSDSSFNEGYVDIADIPFRFIDLFNMDGVQVMIFVRKDKPEYLDRIFKSIQINIDMPREPANE